MSDAQENPYAAPTELSAAGESEPGATSHEELAGRFTRFAAALVDGFLLMAIIIPVQFASGFLARAQMQAAGVVEQLMMSLFSVVVFVALNGYLLATRGQSIGKMATKIQIVDFHSGRLLPFVKVYVYRYLWTFPLFMIVLLIPGTIDDLLINLVVLVDILMIFGGDRRCLHDLIAGSKVVMYQAGRARLSPGDSIQG